MDTLIQHINALRRPRLLIRAARIGVSEYRRERDLSRLIGASRPPCPKIILEQLIGLEADLEAARIEGHAHYSATRHLDSLIAVMAEAQAAINLSGHETTPQAPPKSLPCAAQQTNPALP